MRQLITFFIYPYSQIFHYGDGNTRYAEEIEEAELETKKKIENNRLR